MISRALLNTEVTHLEILQAECQLYLIFPLLLSCEFLFVKISYFLDFGDAGQPMSIH